MHAEDFCAVIEPGVTRESLNQVNYAFLDLCHETLCYRNVHNVFVLFLLIKSVVT